MDKYDQLHLINNNNFFVYLIQCVRFISGPESQDKLRISFFAEG